MKNNKSEESFILLAIINIFIFSDLDYIFCNINPRLNPSYVAVLVACCTVDRQSRYLLEVPSSEDLSIKTPPRLSTKD